MVKLLEELLDASVMLDYDRGDDIEKKKELLKELQDFIMGGSYTNVRNKEYLLRNVKKPVQDQARDLNLSKPAIYKNKKLINNDLERKVGKNIISNILAGDFDRVNTVLDYALSEQSISSIVIPSVIDRVQEKEFDKNSTYDLNDCITEISFLKKYSNLDLELLLSNCDSDKLNYLLRLLDFKESDVESRIRLVETIKR
ncbi:hypothetical protein COF68_05275 [Bacillus toyonensis]|uniref:hypothetical protein n=1 Tax=Bacillus toyonensis TaxID=155322 RepID=UPI000BFDFF35|nr:hypothetical protein [Bacillus toyonensis]PHE64255.1 hypothetical protein COF68_05275 [Bacillus toyonensis]